MSETPDATRLQSIIIAIFQHDLNLEVDSVEADLIETGVLDSLSLVNLLMHIERRCGVTIALENLVIDDFRSIQSISSFVARSNGVNLG